MMSPKKGSRQAMKQETAMKMVRHTRRTTVFLRHHTGARMLPNWQSQDSNIGWQYTCACTATLSADWKHQLETLLFSACC